MENEIRNNLQKLRSKGRGRFDMTGNRDHSSLQQKRARFYNHRILMTGLLTIEYDKHYMPVVYFWKGAQWCGYIDFNMDSPEYIPVIDLDGGYSTVEVITQLAKKMING
ncbi:MAG: hypothetical protein K0U41_05570 [Gammaproteobacteria bacterium]|nr:hypothetical protein [Gammaproteobacteria bacterium]